MKILNNNTVEIIDPLRFSIQIPSQIFQCIKNHIHKSFVQPYLMFSMTPWSSTLRYSNMIINEEKKIKTYIDKKLGTLDPAASCSAVQRCPKMIIPAEHIFYRNCSRFVKGLSSFCRMSDSPRHYSILIILAENYPFSIAVFL